MQDRGNPLQRLPLYMGKVVRKVSWRRTIALRLWVNPSALSTPCRRTASGILKTGRPGDICSRNHCRCWAEDRGRSPARATGCNGSMVRRGWPAWWARCARRAGHGGLPKRLSRGSCTCNASCTRAMIWVPSKESPPSAKSCVDTHLLAPEHLAQIAATTSSTGVRGARMGFSGAVSPCHAPTLQSPPGTWRDRHGAGFCRWKSSADSRAGSRRWHTPAPRALSPPPGGWRSDFVKARLLRFHLLHDHQPLCVVNLDRKCRPTPRSE